MLSPQGDNPGLSLSNTGKPITSAFAGVAIRTDLFPLSSLALAVARAGHKETL
jgi:hypothetical protein